MGEFGTIHCQWPSSGVPPPYQTKREDEEDYTTSMFHRLVEESSSNQCSSHKLSSSEMYVTAFPESGPHHLSTSSRHPSPLFGMKRGLYEQPLVGFDTSPRLDTFSGNPFQPQKVSNVDPLELLPRTRREVSLLEDTLGWVLPSPTSGGFTSSASSESAPSPSLPSPEDSSFAMAISFALQERQEQNDSAIARSLALDREIYTNPWYIPSEESDEYPVDLNDYRYEVDIGYSLTPRAPTPPPRPAIKSQVRCLTCDQPCILSRTPLMDYEKPSSSKTTPGLLLSCPFNHVYCLHCFRKHVSRAMAFTHEETKESPLSCYHCLIIGYPAWKMEMDVVASAFSPGEVWKWRGKLFCGEPVEANPNSVASTSKVVEPKQKRLRIANPDATCGICMESIYVVDYPITESNNSSDDEDLYGLALPCPRKHKYCLECISQYIRTELEKASEGRTVFPIRCPECPQDEWDMTDDVAERALGQDVLNVWHFQKLLDSIEKMYCPHAECSALVEVPELHGLNDATCPSCQKMICVPCRTPWHPELTCAQNKIGQNDKQTYDLAKRFGWRRCPKCRMIVERSEGCPHMSCRCGSHFCYRCGSAYVRGTCPLGSRCHDIPDESLTVTPPAPVKPPSRWHTFFRKIGLRR